MLVAAPPPPINGVDIWGQPPHAAGVADRPLGSTLALFVKGKTVTVPTWRGRTMSAVASAMKAGVLATAKARRVGSLYLVPTSTGGLCVQGPTFLTCYAGLLPGGVTYGFQSTFTGIAVYGIAANDVGRVSLGNQAATVHDNVFVLTRRMKLTSSAHLPRTFGTLVVSYRDGRPPAHVAIR